MADFASKLAAAARETARVPLIAAGVKVSAAAKRAPIRRFVMHGHLR